MQPIACFSFSEVTFFHSVKWLMQTEDKYFLILSLSLSSRAHPGGPVLPGWAIEDREVWYEVVVIDRFHSTLVLRSIHVGNVCVVMSDWICPLPQYSI